MHSCLVNLECCSCRKDIKFVSDIEKEMRMLVEAVNKVSIQILCMDSKNWFRLGGV